MYFRVVERDPLRQALSRNQVAALLGISPAAIGTTERNAQQRVRAR